MKNTSLFFGKNFSSFFTLYMFNQVCKYQRLGSSGRYPLSVKIICLNGYYITVHLRMDLEL